MLGSAFFTAFVGMFDTENERIGFAESTRTLPGSSIACIGSSCGAPILPTPGTDEPTPGQGSSATRKNAIFLIIALLIIAIATCAAVYYCKKRSARQKEAEKVHGRQARGKKGYAMQDEREDDSDEEDNLRVDYAKPMINK